MFVDFFEDACALQFADSRGGVVRCSGVLVEVGSAIENKHFDALFGKENREDQA